MLLTAAYLICFGALNLLGAREYPGRADCILVPGARVTAEGVAGPSLQGRLDRALKLHREGRAPGIACTGGRGESGHVEAQVAREFLAANGVPQHSIVTENMSHTTWENFVFAAQEMRRRGWRSCLVVTDPFHMQRCLTMARELGLEAYPAPSFDGPGWRLGGMLYYTNREMAAWVKYAGESAGRELNE